MFSRRKKTFKKNFRMKLDWARKYMGLFWSDELPYDSIVTDAEWGPRQKGAPFLPYFWNSCWIFQSFSEKVGSKRRRRHRLNKRYVGIFRAKHYISRDFDALSFLPNFEISMVTFLPDLGAPWFSIPDFHYSYSFHWYQLHWRLLLPKYSFFYQIFRTFISIQLSDQ